MTTFCLVHQTARRRAMEAIASAPEGYTVKVEPPKRSMPQNDRMWALLESVASQVVWHGQKLSKEEWKTMFTAALKKQRVLPGIDGGFVVMGDSTSRMSVSEMSDLQTLIEAFAIEQGVDLEGYSVSNEAATA